MAFFDKLKGVFDRGGIGLKLELPKKFSWGDPTIPATLTFTGHKSEPRHIEHLSFTLMNYVKQSEDNSSNDRSGNVVQMEHEYPGTIDLAPGQTVTLTIDVPAYIDLADVDAALGEAGVPKLLRGAMTFMGRVSTKPEDVTYYELTAFAHVEGVKNPKRTSRRILNQKSQGFKFKTKVAGIDIS